MHDIRLIRDDSAAFDAGLARRGLAPQAAALIALDEARRGTITQVQAGLARRNEASKAIGAAKAARDEAGAAALMAEVAMIKQALPALEAEEARLGADLDGLLAALPNLPLADVPDGADEDDNLMVAEHGRPRDLGFPPREHDAIGPALGLDFETGVKLAGARFTLLRGPAARLHRALGQFMLSVLADEHGYEQVVPPLLVRDEALFGTGNLPKFADDLFRTTDGRWLIPTAEVSLTNIVAGEILAEEALPLRFAALTPCFRLGGGGGRARHPRLHPPAPVREGGDGLDRHARRVGGGARADDLLRRGYPDAARPAVPSHETVRGRHGFRRRTHL